MEDRANALSERLLDYGVEIVKFAGGLGRTMAGKHIANQLLRSGTSAGANYEEARGAQSRADFVHKMQVVLKEIRESHYWLKLVQRSAILDGRHLDHVLSETEHLSKMIARSVITAKRRAKQ